MRNWLGHGHLTRGRSLFRIAKKGFWKEPHTSGRQEKIRQDFCFRSLRLTSWKVYFLTTGIVKTTWRSSGKKTRRQNFFELFFPDTSWQTLVFPWFQKPLDTIVSPILRNLRQRKMGFFAIAFPWQATGTWTRNQLGLCFYTGTAPDGRATAQLA